MKKVYGGTALTTRRPGEWDGKECNTCHKGVLVIDADEYVTPFGDHYEMYECTYCHTRYTHMLDLDSA